MKILVTGGAGFIGSNLVDELIGQNHEVIVIDDLSTGNKKNLNEKAKFFELGIADKKLENVFKEERPQAVFHMAAQIDITKSVEDPIWDANQNIIGSINLLENCKKYQVEKIIFSSTAGVYGDTDDVPTPEDHAKLPPSPYGIGKLATEYYLNYYYQTFNLPYTVLRYSNVYGPRQIAKGEGGVVAIFSRAFVSGEAPTVFGDGKQTRDFIYVSDVVKANILALESDKVGVYNISTSQETDVNQLAQVLKDLSGSQTEINYGPARSVDQARSALDFSNAKKDLGFSPEVELKEGLEKTIEWFKK